jgi:hypothetical protein
MRLFFPLLIVLLVFTGCENSSYYQTHRAPPPEVPEFKVGAMLPKDAERFVIRVNRSSGAMLPIFDGSGGMLMLNLGSSDSSRSARAGALNVLAQSGGRPVVIIFDGPDGSFTAKVVKDAIRGLSGATWPNLHLVYVGSRRESAAVERAVQGVGAVYYFEESKNA